MDVSVITIIVATPDASNKNKTMTTPKVLINIADGKIQSVISNCHPVEVHVHNMDSLNGIQRVEVQDVSPATFNLLIAPAERAREIAPLPMSAAQHNAFPKGRW